MRCSKCDKRTISRGGSICAHCRDENMGKFHRGYKRPGNYFRRRRPHNLDSRTVDTVLGICSEITRLVDRIQSKRLWRDEDFYREFEMGLTNAYDGAASIAMAIEAGREPGSGSYELIEENELYGFQEGYDRDLDMLVELMHQLLRSH